MNDTDKLRKEKQELMYTFYHDFINGVRKNSIYKSIQLVHVKDGTAFYECEPYDKEYKCSNYDQSINTFEKIEGAFRKYYRDVFEKYKVDNISVDLYDENSCIAGISVLPDGKILTSNF